MKQTNLNIPKCACSKGRYILRAETNMNVYRLHKKPDLSM